AVPASAKYFITLKALSTALEKTRVFPAAIRKVVPISRLHRLKIRTEMAGCFRRSQHDFPVANGRRREHQAQTSQLSLIFCTRRSSVTANMSRRMPNITGGIGMRRT